MTSRQLDEEAICHIARKLDDPADREKYLDQVLAGDEGLRARVERLLEIHEGESELLKSSPDPGPTEDQAPIRERPGQQIGRYKLLDRRGITIDVAGRDRVLGPEMEWSDFREQYRTLHLATLRDNTAMHAESRLDLAERIMKPKTLGALADPNTLQQLQAKLLAGEQSLPKKPRSSHTVRGYMNSILAALNWAHLQGWLPTAPRIRKIKTPKLKVMKGRPITEAEFKEMLEATAGVVGDEAAESWDYVLRGMWESALRLEEMMHVSWNLPGTIRPIWEDGRLPILDIPAAMQKTDTEENIPLLPWFESLLLETPPEQRQGWVFEPLSLQLRLGRKVRHHRPDAEWVGKVVARIGEAAGIVVEQADERTGRPTKYGTAHDLRRSCGERLRNAGVPPLVICRVMRHASWETTRKSYAPGDVQRDAEVLRSTLRPTDSGPETKNAG